MSDDLKSLLADFRKLPANDNLRIGSDVDIDAGHNAVRSRLVRLLDGMSEPVDDEDAGMLLQMEPLLEADEVFRRLRIARFSRSEQVYARVRADIENRMTAPLCRAEMRIILEQPMDRWAHYLATGVIYADDEEQAHEDDGGDRTLRLSRITAYMDFARTTFRQALARIRQIHAGDAPYESDKAWALEDAYLLGRLARIGLALDEDWCRETLPELWRLSALAPVERLKSAPSQALTLQIAKAVIAHPRRYAVEAMAVVHQQVRHAGLKKKLTGQRKRAETAMISDPGFLRELPQGEALPKKLKSSLKRAIERLFFDSRPVERFAEGFAAHKDIAPLAARLLWRVESPDGDFTARPRWEGAAPQWLRLDGAAAPMRAADRATLWHPVEAAPEERIAWRERLGEDRITQPFAQAHREHYRPQPAELETPRCDLFRGYEIGTNPVHAVATGLGWTKTYDSFTLDISGLRFQWLMEGGGVIPGGSNITGSLALADGADRLEEVEPRILSEVLRQIDLFTSLGLEASGAGMGSTGDALQPGEKSIENRGLAIRSLFAGEIRDGGMTLGRRHVETRGLRLHLGTLRLTRDGDPVEPPALSAVSFLPYEDASLKKAVQILSAIIATS